MSDLPALGAVQLDVRMLISDIAAVEGVPLPSAELPIAGLEVGSHQPHAPMTIRLFILEPSYRNVRIEGWC